MEFYDEMERNGLSSGVRNGSGSQCAIASLVVLLAFAGTCGAVEGDSDHFYRVQGSTAAELVQSIADNSPGRSFGFTENYGARVSWEARPDGSGCSIVKIQYSHTIRVHMPIWTDKALAKRCLQENWERTWAAVYRHEETHRQILRQLETDIPQRLGRIRIPASCRSIEAVAQAEYQKIVAENQALHAEFHRRDAPLILQEC